MSDSAALERRYRRLLTWFPPEHRRVYGEEMIGVLLSSAPDGQDRPGPGDVVNLVSSGLITRLRTWWGTRKTDWTWGDALTAYRIVAPVLMGALIWFPLDFVLRYHPTRWINGLTPGVGVVRPILLLMAAATVAAFAVAAACPALIRRGHPVAAALATAGAMLLGVAAAADASVTLAFGTLVASFTAFVLVNLAAVVIVPDPGRGWRALTVRRTYRRLLALLAIPLCPVFSFDLQPVILGLSTLTIAALVGLAIWRSSRKRLLS